MKFEIKAVEACPECGIAIEDVQRPHTRWLSPDDVTTYIAKPCGHYVRLVVAGDDGPWYAIAETA